jgi:succinate dehydrogenase/fumarate reductase flavoprotein subunit
MGVEHGEFLEGAVVAGAFTATEGHRDAKAGAQSDNGGRTAADADLFTPEDLKRKWPFEIAPDPIADDRIEEVIDAEVVVVGCGTAGLLTAISALKHGVENVIIISASQAPVSRGGSNNCVYSKYMEEIGLAKIPVKHFQREISQMYNNCKQTFWYKYYNNSTEVMDYLIDLMVSRGYTVAMERAANIPEDDLYHEPFCSHAFLDGEEFNTPGIAQPLLVRTVAEEFEAQGGTIHFGTKAEQLIRDDNNTGRVSAVVAKRFSDGSYVKYTASKAVVLATGDFSKDRDMMYRFVPDFAPILEEQGTFDTPVDYDKGLDPFVPGLMPGDGQKMGLWVGAAWQKNYPNTLVGGTFFAGPAGTYSQGYPGLIVDRNGLRFMNEFASTRMAGKSMWHTDGSQAFAIWDANYASYPGMWFDTWDVKSPTTPPDVVMQGWDLAVERGYYCKDDTLEGLVGQLGLPVAATMATIERYNRMCEAGEDTDFYKRKEGLNVIDKAPYYGAKSGRCDFLTVLGGLRTNSDLQVCEEDDTAIPGLYNVGTMIGDMYSGIYTFQLQGANYGASCVTLGYLTGKYIAENE